MYSTSSEESSSGDTEYETCSASESGCVTFATSDEDKEKSGDKAKDKEEKTKDAPPQKKDEKLDASPAANQDDLEDNLKEENELSEELLEDSD